MTPCSTAILAAKVKLPILHLKHRDFHSRSCMKVLRENCGVINDCESAKRNERGKEKISVLLRSGREAKSSKSICYLRDRANESIAHEQVSVKSNAHEPVSISFDTKRCNELRSSLRYIWLKRIKQIFLKVDSLTTNQLIH